MHSSGDPVHKGQWLNSVLQYHFIHHWFDKKYTEAILKLLVALIFYLGNPPEKGQANVLSVTLAEAYSAVKLIMEKKKLIL